VFWGDHRHRLEPGESRWQLEQRRHQLPVGEPQQRRPRQPQRQPRSPPAEHMARPEGRVYGSCLRAGTMSRWSSRAGPRRTNSSCPRRSVGPFGGYEDRRGLLTRYTASLRSRGRAPGRGGLLPRSPVSATLQVSLHETLHLALTEEVVSFNAQGMLSHATHKLYLGLRNIWG
jgi:hypothetical protein